MELKLRSMIRRDLGPNQISIDLNCLLIFHVLNHLLKGENRKRAIYEFGEGSMWSFPTQYMNSKYRPISFVFHWTWREWKGIWEQMQEREPREFQMDYKERAQLGNTKKKSLKGGEEKYNPANSQGNFQDFVFFFFSFQFVVISFGDSTGWPMYNIWNYNRLQEVCPWMPNSRSDLQRFFLVCIHNWNSRCFLGNFSEDEVGKNGVCEIGRVEVRFYF